LSVLMNFLFSASFRGSIWTRWRGWTR